MLPHHGITTLLEYLLPFSCKYRHFCPCANYSLSAILRMMNALNQNSETNIEQVLNTPGKSEDIVSACDKLILSLHVAEKNATQIVVMLNDIKNKYANPPLKHQTFAWC